MRAPTFKKKATALLVAILAYSLIFPAYIFALPQGGQVVAGQADITNPSAQVMQINQATQKAIINWQQFSIAAPEAVNFAQPNAAAIALNRVIGVDPSVIYGSLTANGGVWVINPAGILVGSTGVINVNSFLASTLDILDDDFMSGNYNFSQRVNESLAAIVNQGTISAASGGNVSLIAPGIVNQGTIVASLGKVNLGAGEQVTLNFQGNELINFAVDKSVLGEVLDPDGLPLEDSIRNEGTISAEGGEIVLSARTAYDAIKSVVNNKGVIEAQTVENNNGVIRLQGNDLGIVYNSGTLDVSGLDDGETGGEVEVTGEKTGLIHYSKIKASGRRGGGKVFVGGGFQGKNPSIKNGKITYMGKDATIEADAIDEGNGGEVIVWADDTTRFYGDISARGGSSLGDGGFVEVSGKEALVFQGDVNASAANGKAGVLLLDPTNINIGDSPTYDYNSTDDLSDNIWNKASDGTQIDTTTIYNHLFGGNDLELQASDTITWTTGATLDYNGIGTGRTLTLKADDTIFWQNNGKIWDSNSTGDNLSVILNADADNSGVGAIQLLAGATIETNGGNITLGGGLDPTADEAVGDQVGRESGITLTGATLNAGTGNISLRGRGLASTGVTNGIFIEKGTDLITTSGDITLVGFGGSGDGTGTNRGVLIQATTTDPGASISSTGGNINITGTGVGDGTSADNVGIFLADGVSITNTTGSVTLNGTGGSGTNNNYGVLIRGQFDGADVTTISATDGQIEITGTGQGSGSDNYGVYVQSFAGRAGNKINTTNGAGTAPGIVTAAGTNIIGDGATVGNITLRASTASGTDSISLADLTIQSSGSLFLEPSTGSEGDSIGIAGGAGTFNLTTTELDFIQDGFSQITIGHSAGTGTVTFGDTTGYAFKDPVKIQAGGSGGSISIAHALSTNTANDDIDLSADTISLSAADADISTTGTGAVTLDAVRNIAMTSGSSITTVDGAINLAANQGVQQTGTFTGIQMDAATLTTTSGTVTLDGRGGVSAAGDAFGVYIIGGSVIESTGSTGSEGSITITGTGGTGDNNHVGVVVNSSSTTPETRVESVHGDISITGYGGSSADTFNRGVVISFGGQVLSTGSATIDIDGTADSTGTGSSYGVHIYESSGSNPARVSSATGDIQITGQGGSSDGYGIFIANTGVVESTGSADITLIGTGGSTDAGIATSTGSNVIGGASATGDITLRASSGGTDSIALANVSIQSSGNLILEPGTASDTIGIGDGATGLFNLDATTELATLADGFAGITIGRSDGTGSVAVNAVTFNDPIKIQSPGSGGSITVAGALQTTGTDRITLAGETIDVNADITAGSGGAAEFSSSLNGMTVAGNITATGLTFNNNVEFDGGAGITWDSGAGYFDASLYDIENLSPTNEILTLDGDYRSNFTRTETNAAVNWDLLGPIGVGGTVATNDFTITDSTAFAGSTVFSGTVNLTGTSINTSANQLTFNDAVTLTGDSSVTSGGADLIFNSTIDDDAAGGSNRNLTLITTDAGGDGNVTLGNVGDTTPLGSFTITGDTGTITLNGSSIRTSAAGGQSGDITFGTSLKLTADTVTTTSSGNLDYSSTQVYSDSSGPWDLSIDTTSGTNAGNVTLSNFSDRNEGDTDTGTFVNKVTINTDDTGTDGNLIFDAGTINLDNDGAEAADFVFTGDTADVIVQDTVTIDIEQGDNENAGNVNFGNSNVYAGAASKNLTIDATSSGGSNGTVTMGVVDDEGGVSSFINDLTIDAGTFTQNGAIEVAGAVDIDTSNSLTVGAITAAGSVTLVSAADILDNADAGADISTAAAVSLTAANSIGATGLNNALDLASTVDLTLDANDDLVVSHDGATNLTDLAITLDAGGAATYDLTNFANITETITTDGTDLTVTALDATNAANVSLTVDTGHVTVTSFGTTTTGTLGLTASSGDIVLADGAISTGSGPVAVSASGTIDESTDANTVNITTTGALTLSSGGAIGANADLNEHLDIDVGSVNVTATGGSDVSLRDAGTSDTTYIVTTGGAGAVSVNQGANDLIVDNITTTGTVTLVSAADILDNADAGADISTAAAVSLTAANSIGATGLNNALDLASTVDLTLDANDDLVVSHDGATNLTDLAITLDAGGAATYDLTNFANITETITTDGTDLTVTALDATNAANVSLTVDTGHVTVTSFGTTTTGTLGLTASSGDIVLADGAISTGSGAVSVTAATGNIRESVTNTNTNITTNGTLTLSSSTGIGQGGVNEALDTAVDTLDASTTGAGSIYVSDTGTLTLGSAADITVGAVDEHIDITASGLLTVDRAVTVTGDGNVNLAGLGVTITTANVDGSFNQDVSAVDGAVTINANNGGNGTLTLEDGTGPNRRSRLVSTHGDVSITAEDLIIQANDTADQIIAGNNLTIDSGAGNSIGLGDDAVLAASDFEMNDAEMDALSAGGALTIGSTDAGRILIDRASAFGSDLALISSGTIIDVDTGVAFENTTGTLTLTSGQDAPIGSGAIDLNVNVAALVVTDTDGTGVSIADAGGSDTTYTINTQGDGDINITQNASNLIVADIDTTGDVTLDSVAGNINDGAAVAEVIEAVELRMNSQLGIASLNTSVDSLAAETEEGNLQVINDSALSITTVNSLSGLTITDTVDDNGGNDIEITTAGTLTVSQAVNNNDQGTITLTANNDTSDISVQAALNTAGTGEVTVQADNGVTFGAAGSILATGAGNVVVTADADTDDVGAARVITMDNLATIDGGSGTIALTADGDITLGGLTTLNTSATAITLGSSAGGIVDGGDASVDVVAASGRLVINSVTGVGVGDDIETTVASLDITNTTSGIIDIDETNALDIFTILQGEDDSIQVIAGGAVEVLAAGTGVIIDDTSNNDGDADITIQAEAGTITVSDLIRNDSVHPDADIVLNADGDASDVAVNAGITAQAGDVTVQADNGVTFGAAGSIFAGLAGNVVVTADADGDDTGLGRVITMTDGATIDGDDGTIALVADGDISLAGLTTLSAMDTAVTLTTTGGGIIDNGDSAIDVYAASGRLVINSATGVGIAGGAGGDTDIETTVASLDITNTTSGVIDIDETNALDIFTILQGEDDSIQVIAGGAVEVLAAGTGVIIDDTGGFNGDADITIQAEAGTITVSDLIRNDSGNTNADIVLNADGDASDVAVNAGITTAAGDVTVLADNGVTFSAAGSILATGAGNVVVTADADGDNVGAARVITMDNLATIDGGGGTLALAADGDITLGGLTTLSALDTAVTLTSSAGGIVDGGDAFVDVVAATGRLVIDAVTGVGTGGAIETTVASLDVDNGVTSGNIDIIETDTVSVIKLANSVADDNNNTTGTITLTAGDTITVEAAGSGGLGVTTVDGDITLTANTLANADILVNHVITATNSNATASAVAIALNARDSVLFSAAGDVTSNSSATGSIVVTANSDNADGNDNDVITLNDDTLIDAGAGTITLTNTGANHGGDITLGGLLTTNASATAVTLATDAGVVDGGDTYVDVDAANGRLVIDAVTGVGSAAGFGATPALETTVAGLDVDNIATSGDIDINETNALDIYKINQQVAAGTVNVDAGGTITVVSGQSGITALAGQVDLFADGIDSNIAVNESIQTTTGTINILADNDITFGATGAITAITGAPVTVTADFDNLTDSGLTNRGELNMANGSVINAGTGTIDLDANENISLGRLVTTNNTATAVDINSAVGGIVDNGDSGGADIEATGVSAEVTIRAATGVGSSAAIDTAVSLLDVINTGTGNVNINETNAITINRIEQQGTLGTVNVDAGGTILVAAGQNGITADTGQIELDANGIDSSIIINDEIETTTGAINILADNDVTFGFAGKITGTAGAPVTVTADSDGLPDSGGTNQGALTMDDGALISAGTGTIDLNANESISLGRLVTTNNTATAIDINSAAGGIVDSGNTGGADIQATGTSAQVTIRAAIGMGVGDAIETAINDLDATNTINGNIDIINSGNQLLTLTNVANTDGSISIQNTGGINASIEVVSITADTADDVVTIIATGANNDEAANNDLVTDITAATIDLDAVSGIGNNAHIDLAGSTILADSAGGNLDINSSTAAAVTVNSLTTGGTGSIQFDQTGGGALTLNTVTTVDGAVNVSNTGNNLTAESITVGGSNNLTLATIGSGNVVVGTSLDVANDQVDITAVDNITLDGTINTAVANLTATGGAINGGGTLTAGVVDLNAINGIGNTTTLSLASNTIAADTTNGDIDIDNAPTSAVTVTSLTTGTGSVTLDQTGGQTMTLASVATTDGSISISNDALMTATDVQTSGGANDDDISLTASAIVAGAISAAGLGDVSLTANTGSITDAAGKITADHLLADAAGAMTLDTTVNTIDASTSATGVMTITETDNVDLTDVDTFSGPINVLVGGALTATDVQAANGSLNLNASSMTLATVAAPNNPVNLAAGGAINAGTFTGSTGTINAATIGLSSVSTANVGSLFMTLTQSVNSKSGALLRGSLLVNRPPDDNIVSAGSVTIGDFKPYLATLVDVDISAILSSLATQTSAAQQLEALLDATTASEFFMTPPLEIYIDMAEQDEFDESVEDALGDDL